MYNRVGIKEKKIEHIPCGLITQETLKYNVNMEMSLGKIKLSRQKTDQDVCSPFLLFLLVM